MPPKGPRKYGQAKLTKLQTIHTWQHVAMTHGSGLKPMNLHKIYTKIHNYTCQASSKKTRRQKRPKCTDNTKYRSNFRGVYPPPHHPHSPHPPPPPPPHTHTHTHTHTKSNFYFRKKLMKEFHWKHMHILIWCMSSKGTHVVHTLS